MSARLIAIGDVHGCRAALDTVLAAIDPSPGDRIVTLGDYIDRGPDSRGVIERLLELGEQCELISLRGNHEEMLLGGLSGATPFGWWLEHGGKQTLDSYRCEGDYTRSVAQRQIPEEHLEFLHGTRDYYAAKTHFFTHANYAAHESLASQPVEALRWQGLTEHTPAPHQSGRIAVVGHTAQRTGEILDLGHLVCIDTFAHGGGWLTAYDVESGKAWQANQEGRLRDEGA